MTQADTEAIKRVLATVSGAVTKPFAVGMKNGETSFILKVDKSSSKQPRTIAISELGDGFMFKCWGRVSKRQGKYLFIEEGSMGTVREAQLSRAMAQDAKASGRLFGGNPISTLPCMWVSAEMAATLPPEEVTLEASPDEAPTTGSATAVAAPEPADPFDDWADAYLAAQADVAEQSEDLEGSFKDLERALVATGDEFLIEVVVADHLPPYREAARKPMLSALVGVGVAQPKDRKGRLTAARKAIGDHLKFLDGHRDEIRAFESQQPSGEGVPIAFRPYRDALETADSVMETILSSVSTWPT